jgi:hypothetical protein
MENMEEALVGLRQNAESFIRQLSPVSTIELGYNEESVKWVSGFIDRNRSKFEQKTIDDLIILIGSFLGECIIENTDGRWDFCEDLQSWGVVFKIGNTCFPFNKTAKHFQHGGGDSIFSFYDTTVNIFSKQKFPPPAPKS